MTIVSIRGTHGSGKSTIVKKILDRYAAVPLKFKDSDKRPYSYLARLPDGSELAVLGPYHTACGGCDAVQPYSAILEYMHGALANDCHVLFEGALVSSSYGTIGHAMNEYAPDAVFAFLDTPLNVCLDRIAARRAAKWAAAGKPGLPPPLNPHNTAVKFENVARTKVQMAKLGSAIRIVDIDHTQAVRQVLNLFDVRLNKEPA